MDRRSPAQRGLAFLLLDVLRENTWRNRMRSAWNLRRDRGRRCGRCREVSARELLELGETDSIPDTVFRRARDLERGQSPVSDPPSNRVRVDGEPLRRLIDRKKTIATLEVHGLLTRPARRRRSRASARFCWMTSRKSGSAASPSSTSCGGLESAPRRRFVASALALARRVAPLTTSPDACAALARLRPCSRRVPRTGPRSDAGRRVAACSSDPPSIGRSSNVRSR